MVMSLNSNTQIINNIRKQTIPSENFPHLTVTGKIDQTGGIQHLYTRFFYRFNVFLDANTLNTGHRCIC